MQTGDTQVLLQQLRLKEKYGQLLELEEIKQNPSYTAILFQLQQILILRLEQQNAAAQNPALQLLQLQAQPTQTSFIQQLQHIQHLQQQGLLQ